MGDKELAEALEIWFDNINKNNRNLLTRNPVAKILKTKLSEWGYWKNKPRGKSNCEFTGANSQEKQNCEFTGANKQDCDFTGPNSQNESNCELTAANSQDCEFTEANSQEKTNCELSAVNSQTRFSYTEKYHPDSINLSQKNKYKLINLIKETYKNEGTKLPPHFAANINKIVFEAKEDHELIKSQIDACFWDEIQIIKKSFCPEN